MTVTYQEDMGTASTFGSGIWQLLCRWRGSIYRLLWADLLVYALLYTLFSLIYRLALNDDQKIIFEDVVRYSESFSEKIPLGFVLGFYCSLVGARWWMQLEAIPNPNTLCMNVTMFLNGQDGNDQLARMMRRSIARYANLAINLALANLSPYARRRFDTLEKLVTEGFLTEDEKTLLSHSRKQAENCKAIKKDSKFWIPLMWATSIATKARDEELIQTESGYLAILTELTNLRCKCETLLTLSWINIPLVYGQVVTIGVYSFFVNTLLGRQFIRREFDLYIPFFTLLQFLFYMGWLKTAETMINPFGEDDDDFDIPYIINRNHEMGYLIVDKFHNKCPALSQDIYWEIVIPPPEEATVEMEDLPIACNDDSAKLLD